MPSGDPNSPEGFYSTTDPSMEYGGTQYGQQVWNQGYGANIAAGNARQAPLADYSQFGVPGSQAAFTANQAKQAALAQALQGNFAGTGPTAAPAQFQQGLDQSLSAQLAARAGAQGGGPQGMAAQLAAQQGAGQMGMGNALQAAQTRGAEQNAAAQGLGQLYGTMGQQAQMGAAQGIGAAQFNTQQQFQQEQLNQANQLANQQFQQNVNEQQLQANAALYGTQAQAAAAMAMQQQGQQSALTNSLIAGGAQVGGQLLKPGAGGGGGGGGQGTISQAQLYDNSSFAPMGSPDSYDPNSDERLKEGIEGEGQRSLADEFLRHMDPKSFRYKDPANEPRPVPTGGRYLGVMAQNIERTPEVGRQMVYDTPTGKRVATGPTLMAALAGLGRLDEHRRDLEQRMEKVERKT
jgi:hypothetical protein